MPRDLVDADLSIIVHDRTGARQPFSRGIMAASLLPTGVATEEAHRLASLVHARLLHHDRTTVESNELIELAAVTLDEQSVEAGLRERWLGWRRARQSGRPIVVVLCGAPGVGKGTVATRLAVRLGVTQVVSTDATREVMRLAVPPMVHPELHRSTYDLLNDADAPRFAGFDRQCATVADATVAVAARLAAANRSVIIEGVHLTPGMTTAALAAHPSRPIVVERVLTISDSARHARHLVRRNTTEPLRDGDRHDHHLHTIRSIQRHLMTRARRAGVEALDARTTADLTQRIVDEIAAHTLGRAA